jgi:hypothetical protein
MCPILEERFVDALSLVEMVAPIRRDAGVKDMVMAALDDVNGVYLQISQISHRRWRGFGPNPERRTGVEALGAEPDPARLCRAELLDHPRRSL